MVHRAQVRMDGAGGQMQPGLRTAGDEARDGQAGRIERQGALHGGAVRQAPALVCLDTALMMHLTAGRCAMYAWVERLFGRGSCLASRAWVSRGLGFVSNARTAWSCRSHMCSLALLFVPPGRFLGGRGGGMLFVRRRVGGR